MCNNPRVKHHLFSGTYYSLVDFAKVGFITFICMIVIGSFMRIVFEAILFCKQKFYL